MYLGVDIGGTKTLVASLNNEGVIQEKFKFPTPQDYQEFLTTLRQTLDKFVSKDFEIATVAAPYTRIDRSHGIALRFGNLPWESVSLERDIEKIVGCTVLIDNDAKLAGLSEAMMVKGQYSKVLFVTVSTGIGYAMIKDCRIDENSGDGGGKILTLDRNDKLTPWESLASGQAIVKKYGKMAKDIDDQKVWRKISRDLASGLIELIEVFQPDVIVIGGSVGNYFDKFGGLLEQELMKFDVPLLTIPPLKGAERADDAVIYGCYDLAKQVQADG